MPIKIHGKDYKTVAERIEESRNDVTSIKTNVIHFDEKSAIVQATVQLGDKEFTGSAMEFRDDPKSLVNKTSYIENAETSAVGRALAFAGYAGSEIASADEVLNAIKRGEENSQSFNEDNGYPKQRQSQATGICDCGKPIKGNWDKCWSCHTQNNPGTNSAINN